jgi:uncharacterized protein (TIRG00374 family)
MKETFKEYLEKIVLSLVFSIIVYSALIFYGNISSLASEVSSFGAKTIFIVFSLTLLSLGLRFLRWQHYLEVLQIDLSKTKSLEVYLIGFSMSLSPGRFGEGIKSYFMKKEHEIALSKSLSAVIFERISDLLALALIAIFSYFFIFLNLKTGILFTILTLIVFYIILTNFRKFIEIGRAHV